MFSFKSYLVVESIVDAIQRYSHDIHLNNGLPTNITEYVTKGIAGACIFASLFTQDGNISRSILDRINTPEEMLEFGNNWFNQQMKSTNDRIKASLTHMKRSLDNAVERNDSQLFSDVLNAALEKYRAGFTSSQPIDRPNTVNA